jgi:hypothetical protein
MARSRAEVDLQLADAGGQDAMLAGIAVDEAINTDLNTAGAQGSAALGNLLLGKIEEEAESPIDRLRVLERLGHVRIEQDDVRTLLVALIVLAAHRSREVVLRFEIVVFRFLTHSAFFPVRLPSSR